jgi:tetratricopeptide (TPR) repeat protein
MTAKRIFGLGGAILAGAALAILTAFATPGARAAGAEPSSSAPSCPSGQYYSERCSACAKRCGSGSTWSCSRKACVKRSSLHLNDGDLYKEAVSLATAGHYTQALETLWSIKDRERADVLTYIGYSTRKLGNVDAGIGYYHKALALDPGHNRAREYLGEGYLQKGDVAGAKTQLREIAARCGTDCREYRMLSGAIIEHATGEKAANATWH